MGSLPSSQANSCQSIRVDGNVQGGLQANTSLQEDKAGDNVKASEQVPGEEQPAQRHVPL